MTVMAVKILIIPQKQRYGGPWTYLRLPRPKQIEDSTSNEVEIRAGSNPRPLKPASTAYQLRRTQLSFIRSRPGIGITQCGREIKR